MDLLAKKRNVDTAMLANKQTKKLFPKYWLREWAHAVLICKPLQLDNKEYNTALPVGDIAGIS